MKVEVHEVPREGEVLGYRVEVQGGLPQTDDGERRSEARDRSAPWCAQRTHEDGSQHPRQDEQLDERRPAMARSQQARGHQPAGAGRGRPQERASRGAGRSIVPFPCISAETALGFFHLGDGG